MRWRVLGAFCGCFWHGLGAVSVQSAYVIAKQFDKPQQLKLQATGSVWFLASVGTCFAEVNVATTSVPTVYCRCCLAANERVMQQNKEAPIE
jgi:hypothetical protein